MMFSWEACSNQSLVWAPLARGNCVRAQKEHRYGQRATITIMQISPLSLCLPDRLRITDLQERHCDVSGVDKQDEALGGEQHENKLVSEGAKDLETAGL